MTTRDISPPNGGRHFARYLKHLSFLMIWFVHVALSQSSNDPFTFFRPSITISNSEHAQLDDGYAIARVLPTKGFEVAVLAATPVEVDGDRLLAWERRIEELKQSSYVLAIGRFSNPPRIEDLAGLELDSGDVSAIRSCRPRNCEIKLSSSEMEQLQSAEAQAQGNRNAAIQHVFRHIVLNRVQHYVADGHIPPSEDHHQQIQPASRFALLLDHMPFLRARLPQLVAYLRAYPLKTNPEVESFLYWSKEHFARKAVTTVTQVSMVRNDGSGLPEILIVGRNIFSSHYIDASLSVTALMRGDANGKNYLVYINRTEVDVLHGAFGGIIRHSIQDHLKKTTETLTDLRRRLESGTPLSD